MAGGAALALMAKAMKAAQSSRNLYFMLKQYGRWGERFKEKTRLFSMHRPCIRRRAARQAAPKRVLNKSKRRKRRGKDILENLAGNDPGGKVGISQVRGEFCPAPPQEPITKFFVSFVCLV
jgi:hypothetical protein